LAVVLIGAGSVLMLAGVAGASTDPEVEREASASSTMPTTMAAVPVTTSAGTTTTTVVETSTTSTAATTSTTTTLETTTTTTSTTSLPVAGGAEQLPPFWLRGLCATPNAFIFAMSNLDTAPVDVALVFNGVPFDTVALAAGEVYGFRTDAPGTMVANLPGATFQTESVDAPCPVAQGSVGLGGLCRDPTTGYQWLMGNSGPDPVDVEIRLEGTVVGTFTLESGGFAGFTTLTGGQAEALVGGQVVAEASSSEAPCVRGPVSFFATCFAPGQGYRWFVNNDTETPLVLELRVGGSPQAVLTLAPFEGRDLTTSVGGLGELLENGEVIASAMSENVLCDTMISLFSSCADAASGVWWNLSSGAPTAVEVRLVLDGVEVDVVTLQPGETREFSTPESGTMEAFVGTQLVARSETAVDPCVTIFPMCVDLADGQVWALEPLRPAVVEVRIGGVSVGTFDLTSGGRQIASALPGSAEVLIGGIVVDEADPPTDPCVSLFADCFDPANGYVFGLLNMRDEPRTAELRIGTEVRAYPLEPFAFVGFALPSAGPIEVFVDGQLVQTVEGSDAECESPAVFLTGSCFAAESGNYLWDVSSQRPFDMTVELRLAGTPAGSVALVPGDFKSVSNPNPGTMQAFVNGVFVAEAPSADTPCFEPPPTVAPARLPGTGGGAGGPLTVGLASVVAGLLVLATTRRRRDHRTPVRS
jgi:hypothetical protein